MAETLQGLVIEVKIRGRVIGSDGAYKDVSYSKQWAFADGTSSNQLGSVWEDEVRSLNTTSEDLDLVGTGLTDFQGAALAFNNVKVLLIENLDTDTGDYFLLKEGSSNPVTTILGGTSPTLTIGPGGLALLINPIDGYAVTGGSADVLAMQAADNSTYRILVAGDNA